MVANVFEGSSCKTQYAGFQASPWKVTVWDLEQALQAKLLSIIDLSLDNGNWKIPKI